MTTFLNEKIAFDVIKANPRKLRAINLLEDSGSMTLAALRAGFLMKSISSIPELQEEFELCRLNLPLIEAHDSFLDRSFGPKYIGLDNSEESIFSTASRGISLLLAKIPQNVSFKRKEALLFKINYFITNLKPLAFMIIFPGGFELPLSRLDFRRYRLTEVLEVSEREHGSILDQKFNLLIGHFDKLSDKDFDLNSFKRFMPASDKLPSLTDMDFGLVDESRRFGYYKTSIRYSYPKNSFKQPIHYRSRIVGFRPNEFCYREYLKQVYEHNQIDGCLLPDHENYPRHYLNDRPLSLREYARLLAIPDWYSLSMDKERAYKALMAANSPLALENIILALKKFVVDEAFSKIK